MADTKISALTAATTPLVGTEVLPIVQSGATVKVANNDLRPKQIQSNATSGVLQVAGPTAATTRVMTTPDANFTVARTDAAQTFSGAQTFQYQSGRFWAISATSIISQQWDDNGLITFSTNSNLGLSGAGQGIRYIYNLGGGGTSRNAATVKIVAESDYSTDANADAKYVIGTAINNVLSDQFEIRSSGDAALLNGNLVIGTSGKGIDFSATPGTGTSELLADYEEGTWSPSFYTAINGGGSLIGTATNEGYYTKIGRLVTCTFYRGALAGSNHLSVSVPFAIPANSITSFTTADGSFGYGDVGSYVNLRTSENQYSRASFSYWV